MCSKTYAHRTNTHAAELAAKQLSRLYFQRNVASVLPEINPLMITMSGEMSQAPSKTEE